MKSSSCKYFLLTTIIVEAKKAQKLVGERQTEATASQVMVQWMNGQHYIAIRRRSKSSSCHVYQIRSRSHATEPPYHYVTRMWMDGHLKTSSSSALVVCYSGEEAKEEDEHVEAGRYYDFLHVRNALLRHLLNYFAHQVIALSSLSVHSVVSIISG